jgi:Fic family protein
MSDNKLDLSRSIPYHLGKFPPASLDLAIIMEPLLQATDALARYDQMLKSMHNSELFLAPLRSQEAVISSRMEGTISTMDEILQYQAEYPADEGAGEVRSEVIETLLYRRALNTAQQQMENGYPLGDALIRSIHGQLLSFGSNANKTPGAYKTAQNYIGDRGRQQISFVPISPEHLAGGLERLFAFMENGSLPVLVRTAMAHLEFEALHPFLDGNGRVGRMLVTLMFWKYGVISAPHFYISRYFEDHRDEYIELMREVSRHSKWEQWCAFFLTATAQQAQSNLQTTESIQALYEEMKGRFTNLLYSRWAVPALDYIFTFPVFRNSEFSRNAGIPAPTASRFTRVLLEQGLLQVTRPASGRRSATYRFEPLMKLVRV